MQLICLFLVAKAFWSISCSLLQRSDGHTPCLRCNRWVILQQYVSRYYLILSNQLCYISFSKKIELFYDTDIRNWMKNIEQHASDNVNKILVGNKADMDESKRVSSKSSLAYHDIVVVYSYALTFFLRLSQQQRAKL